MKRHLKICSLTFIILMLPITSFAFDPTACNASSYQCAKKQANGQADEEKGLIGSLPVEMCWRWWPLPIGCHACESQAVLEQKCDQIYSECAGNCAVSDPRSHFFDSLLERLR